MRNQEIFVGADLDLGRRKKADENSEGEKNTRRGGMNCVFKNFFVPYVEELFSGSESEVIQSLSEFRVVCSG